MLRLVATAGAVGGLVAVASPGGVVRPDRLDVGVVVGAVGLVVVAAMTFVPPHWFARRWLVRLVTGGLAAGVAAWAVLSLVADIGSGLPGSSTAVLTTSATVVVVGVAIDTAWPVRPREGEGDETRGPGVLPGLRGAMRLGRSREDGGAPGPGVTPDSRAGDGGTRLGGSREGDEGPGVFSGGRVGGGGMRLGRVSVAGALVVVLVVAAVVGAVFVPRLPVRASRAAAVEPAPMPTQPGERRWTWHAPGEVMEVVAAGAGVVVALTGGEVVALDGPTGKPRWRYARQGAHFRAIRATPDGADHRGHVRPGK